jgi:hypothetical protein
VRTAVVILLALTACQFASSTGNGDDTVVDAPPNDGKAPPDVPPDTPTGPPYCYGHVASVMGQVCLDALPTTPLALTGVAASVNTNPGAASCSDSAIDQSYCVAAHTSISITGGVLLAVTGSRPLVLLSTSTIQMSGVIDIASHRQGNQPLGAGANPTASGACETPTDPSNMGGGGGGSYGLAGGNGGTGDGGTGGIAKGALVPGALRGGCPGGAGGNANGNGGNGGGAIALIADGSIDIDGIINASGQSGAGGASGGSGGGGGGSGGMIVIDARTMITGTGQIFANGGAGGEGSSPGSGGDAGIDSSSPTTAGIGGMGNAGGGDGGTGSRGGTGGGNGGTGATNNGGGGGGGGAGAIRTYGTFSFTGQRSPT